MTMIWERLIDFGANWNGVDSLAWLGFSATRATTMHAYNGSGAGTRNLGLRDGWGVHFAFLFSLVFFSSRVDILLADWLGLAYTGCR